MNNSKENKLINCDKLLIAMGPWSRNVAKYFPECVNIKHIYGSKANSVILKPNTLNKNQIHKNNTLQTFESKIN